MDENARPCPGCIERDRKIDELMKRVAELEKRLDDKERAGKRQAAPFSKGPPKLQPKKAPAPPPKGKEKEPEDIPLETKDGVKSERTEQLRGDERRGAVAAVVHELHGTRERADAAGDVLDVAIYYVGRPHAAGRRC